MEKQASAVAAGTSIFLGTNFIANVLVAGSLTTLWGLVNSMQLMTHFPLTNIHYPINAAIWYSALYQLAAFDLVETDKLEEFIQSEIGDANQSEESFDPKTVLSDSTIQAGFESADVVNGNMLQIVFYSAGVFACLIILIIYLICRKSKTTTDKLVKLRNLFVWNYFIRTLLETAIESSMNAFIRMYFIDTSTWWESLSTSYAFLQLSILTLFGLIVPLFLYKKQSVLTTKAFITRYGALTDQM